MQLAWNLVGQAIQNSPTNLSFFFKKQTNKHNRNKQLHYERLYPYSKGTVEVARLLRKGLLQLSLSSADLAVVDAMPPNKHTNKTC